MVPAISMETMVKKVGLYEEPFKAIGILFAKPQIQNVRESLILEMNYYNDRSNKYIDLFLPGYSLFGHENKDDVIEVGEIDKKPVFFSTEKYCRFLEDFENSSKWQYSGETELLILNTLRGKIDYSNAISIHIEKAVKNESIFSFRTFMEQLIRISKKETETININVNMIAKSLLDSVYSSLIDNIPFGAGKIIKRNQIFIRHNYLK